MPAVSAPIGLVARYHPSGLVRARTMYIDGIVSGFATTIFWGQPVKIIANQGVIQPVAATADDWLGTFDGVEWTDTTGRRRVNNSWIAGTTFIAGSCSIYVVEDPDTVYEIQSDGTVAQTMIYNQMNFSNLTAGNTTNGQSACTAAAAGVGSGQQGQLRVLDIAPIPGNAWGDAFVYLRVQNARSQQRANKVAI